VTGRANHAVARPAGPLQPFIQRYTGYRYSGVTPGIHRGLPAPHLAMIISLGEPTRVTRMARPGQGPREFMGLVGGLHMQPAEITHDGSMAGVQLDLTPAGARSLLGFPAGELGALTVSLEDVLGTDTRELMDRVAEAPDWTSLFGVLDQLLLKRIGRAPSAQAPVARAWDLIVQSHGAAPVRDIARSVGWSRRHLGERFLEEYGLTVKEASRLVRFHLSRCLLQQGRITIADVAAATGYADQAHMAREWRALAGCSPSTWLGTEELLFIQDSGDPDRHTEE
jgi:AraC-like DNA-binding protein